MTRRLNWLIIFSELIGSLLIGQSASSNPLKKGDTFPNVAFTLNVNGVNKEIEVVRMDKKLIILEFWSTQCQTCIDAMPEVLKLQQAFQKEIQIIYVTTENQTVVADLWKRLLQWNMPAETDPIIKAGKEIPFIYSDTLIHQLFPHDGYGVQVWLDENKIYRHLVYPATTTEKNIASFISGEKVNLAEQESRQIDVYNPLSWIESLSVGEGGVESFSIFHRRIENGSSFSHFSVERSNRFGAGFVMSIVNKSIIDLYKIAFFQTPQIDDERIVLRVPADILDRFVLPRKESAYFDWARSNVLCYGLFMNTESKDEVFIWLQQDLEKKFGLSAEVKNVVVNAYVLHILDSNKINLKDPTLPKLYKIEQRDKGLKLVIRDKPIHLLVSRINALVKGWDQFHTFIDETKYSKNVTIEMPWLNDYNKMTLDELNLSLSACGLKLVLEKRNLKRLVIADKTYSDLIEVK